MFTLIYIACVSTTITTPEYCKVDRMTDIPTIEVCLNEGYNKFLGIGKKKIPFKNGVSIYNSITFRCDKQGSL